MDEAETDVPAYMAFPPTHRAKLHSVSPLDHITHTPGHMILTDLRNHRNRATLVTPTVRFPLPICLTPTKHHPTERTDDDTHDRDA
jgi:hypothetical protein